MLTLAALTQYAGALTNIDAIRKIGTNTTRVRFVPAGQKRAITEDVYANFDDVYTSISAQANDTAAYTGHRFVELLRENDGTAYAILCKVCGGIHKIYHTPCYCKTQPPVSEEFRAKHTKNGLTLSKQKLYLSPRDVEQFNLTGVNVKKHATDIRTVQVQQIHEENGLTWGYVMLAGELRLVCAQDDGGKRPFVSEITQAARQWEWALETKH